MLETDAPIARGGGLTTRGLGRVYVPNPGSKNYQLREKLPRTSASKRKSKKWVMPGGDNYFQSQGWTSDCVRFGTTHNLMLTPIVRQNAFSLTTALMPWAKDNDYWDGSDYDGTSVDAGLRYHKNVIKTISRFDWARSMDDVLNRLSLPAASGGGPLVIGVDWYSDMDSAPGYWEDIPVWEPTGYLRGGHCLCITGNKIPTIRREGYVWMGNSHEGNYEALMSYDAIEWLLFAQNGEAAAVTEVPK